MSNTRKTSFDTRRLVGIAVFSALAFVVALVCQVIPQIAGFLSLDFKDAVIAMASFIYGPISAVLIAFIVALIELIFAISGTGWYGFVMNFISSAVFSLVASFIYRKFKSINGALVSFIAAVVSTTSVMLLLNIFVTPLYMKQIGIALDSAGVIDMIPKILMPFNLSKTLLNSALAMLLYKPIAVAMRKIGFAEGSSKQLSFNRSTVIILSAGLAFIAAAVILLLGIPN